MPARISPRSQLYDMSVGEEFSYEIDLSRRLGANTVNSYTYAVYDDDAVDVTSTFGGGDSIAVDVITFGIKAISTGRYTLKFVITCNEFLPDGVTPYEFFVEMIVVIK